MTIPAMSYIANYVTAKAMKASQQDSSQATGAQHAQQQSPSRTVNFQQALSNIQSNPAVPAQVTARPAPGRCGEVGRNIGCSLASAA